jgi:hypothetical protein
MRLLWRWRSDAFSFRFCITASDYIYNSQSYTVKVFVD